MSRRRKKNKRMVLKSPRDNRHPRHMQQRRLPKVKAGKTSKTTMLLMIIALVGFVVGAGIGISMALGDSSSSDSGEVQFENVTVEMTTDLNNTTSDIYDEELDDIDYNNKEDISQYNLTFNNNISY